MPDDLPADPTALSAYRARTPARILAGRAGTGYRTATHLDLRCDHAFARDAVLAELAPDLIERLGLFVVQTLARDKAEYLRRPDLGRKLCDSAREVISRECAKRADLQLVVGDGLSTAAVAAQAPGLLPLLIDGATQRGWSVGRPFVVRYCRVGLMNDVGDVLGPGVVVLLVGERPGLATAESLSAYMAFRPRAGHTDADRNLISNIHARGVGHAEAARRILDLAAQMRAAGTSGVSVKEQLSTPALPGGSPS